ncbi:hypothetical protein [Marinobacter sp. JSM 1782161]|uniref:hypothetical protein n=1 Tax=Marinobacter sp. JSM 1782161 TaxID=2685906 RepID=UPI0014039B7E|nr:hypothetical protein [Marinobacter sp. JSM 1782161]
MSTEGAPNAEAQAYFRFGIRRLVLVDSAGFCYVEIPLNQHALLLGSGNLGKSSLLNSLRLFLLPENNFRNSKNKFAFRNASAGSFYTNEESYQHYFPSQSSFLIMEVESPSGTHCQVLYRDQSSQLSYGRIFVPVAYDQLRGLFWRCEEDDADGIGQAVEGLTVARVTEALKTLSRETTVSSDPTRLKHILYSSDLMSPDAVRYSVLPLADPDERKIQSLRTLILLLFEMKADDKAMAHAVASIIEADKKFADDAFELDIDQFLDRHDQLKSRQEHLTRVESARPQFDKLQSAFERYQTLTRTQHDFAAFRDGLTAALAEIGQQRQQADRERDELQGAQKQSQKQLNSLKTEQNRLEGEIKAQTSVLDKAEKVQKDGELLVSRYGDLTADEIQATLNEALEDSQAQLNALNSAAQAEQRKAQLTRTIDQLDADLKALAEREQRAQWQLQNQLDDDVIAPLRAVNPKLVSASPGQALDEDTKATLGRMAELFAQTDRGFDWFDTAFPARAPQADDFPAQRHKLEGELNAARRHLAELDDSASGGQDRPQRIQQAEKDIAATRKELDILKRLPSAATNIEDATQAIDEANKAVAALEEKTAIERERVEAVGTKLDKAQTVARRAQERETELLHLQTTVSGDMRRFPSLKTVEADAPLAAEAVSVARLDDIRSGLEELEQLRFNILESLRRLINKGIGEDREGLLESDSPSWQAIRDTFKALADLFAGLAESGRVLREQIDSHNETVASYRQALKANSEHIQRFEAALNRELDGVTINDLVEIRVDIHTDPKFHNLVEESAAIDPYASGKLQSDAFYDRLRVFVAEFFGDQKSGNRLTMDKVVTGVSYRTRKQSSTTLDSKGQSTSTTALINLELVHRLLRRVLYPQISLSFPMVLDELASVDVSQVPALLDRLQDQGFNLFSAATHSASPELIFQVGRHLEVGQMRTARPYSASRTLVFWGGPEGFSDREGLSEWFDQTQHHLLEVSHES